MKRKALFILGCILFLVGFVNAVGGNILIGAYISGVGLLFCYDHRLKRDTSS